MCRGEPVTRTGNPSVVLSASVDSLLADEAFGRRIADGKDSYAVVTLATPVQISSLSIIQLWDFVKLLSEPQFPDLLNGPNNRTS